MVKDLVVVTGITGFVGIHAAVLALQAGYRVRGTLRRSDQIDRIKALPEIQPYLEDLEFASVPDIGKEDAYNSALEGAKYVLHIASPLPFETTNPEELQDKIVTPAVNGTIGLLKKAQQIKTIKRIVITSSQVAIVSEAALRGVGGESSIVYNEQSRVYNPPITNNFDAYSASKVLAFNATNEFMEKNKPQFDVITFFPGPVLGPGLLFNTVEGAASSMNGYIGGQILGQEPRPPFSNASVHVIDLAKLHVLALDPKIEGNQDFVATYKGTSKYQWNEVLDIAKKYFAPEIEQGILKLSEGQQQINVLVDGSKVERVFGKVFGFEYKSFEDMVRDVAQQIVDLSK